MRKGIKLTHSRETPFVIGVDGGGTSTEAWLAIYEGPVLGIGKADASNAKAVGLLKARNSLSLAIARAFECAKIDRTPVKLICLGVAGFDRPEDRSLLETWNASEHWAEKLLLVNDGDLVVAAGTPEGWGIGVIAGTGSIAVGNTKDGRKARSGGWGHLIGDEGSAYYVAMAALRLVARRADGRETIPEGGDILGRYLYQTLGVDSPAQIVLALYAPDFDRVAIADLAKSVREASLSDREVDSKIFRPAGIALAEMVRSVARSLDFPKADLPLALAGGFLLNTTEVERGLVESLALEGYQLNITRVPEPARGAVLLAQRALRQDLRS